MKKVITKKPGYKKLKLIAGIGIIAILLLISLAFVANKTNTGNESANDNQKELREQIEKLPTREGTTPKSLNSQQYKMVGANIKCSSNTGSAQRTCTGSLRITTNSAAPQDAGVFRVDESTKLLQNGQERDPSTLNDLAQKQTLIRLTLQEGSNKLAKISY